MAGSVFAVSLLGALIGLTAQQDLEQIFQRFHQGHTEESLAAAREIVEKRPDDPVGHHLLGRFYFHLEQYEEALEHLEICLDLEPEQAWQVAWTHTVLGQTFAALGEDDEARRHLRRAVELKATRNATETAVRALRALGENLESLGIEPEALSPWIGQPIPDFEFHGLAGEVFRARDQRGTPHHYKFGPSW